MPLASFQKTQLPDVLKGFITIHTAAFTVVETAKLA